MHEPLARAMVDCAHHVLGPQATALCIDVPATSDVELQVQRAMQKIADLPGLSSATQRFLLLNDLFGATPYRVAQRVRLQLLHQGNEVFLVSGASLPMLLKAMTDPVDRDFSLFVRRIVDTAARGAQYE